MASVIAVICGEGMPSLAEWNAEMQDARLNVVIQRWINELERTLQAHSARREQSGES